MNVGSAWWDYRDLLTCIISYIYMVPNQSFVDAFSIGTGTSFAMFDYKSVDSSDLWVGGPCLSHILTAGIFCHIFFDLLVRSLVKSPGRLSKC